MNFFPTSIEVGLSKAIAFLVLSLFAITGMTFAYDSPDFDYNLFSADALFLEEDDRTNLMNALTSVASNFPDNPLVDSDLREKAIYLVLKIAPFHTTARSTHETLLQGKIPHPTVFFEKPAMVSEALWKIAEKMLSGKAEPEAARLAPYLVDLSLTISRTPPSERLNKFAQLTDFKLLPWEKFITLQPDDNPSSKKIGMLFSLLKMERPGRPAAKKAPSGQGKVDSSGLKNSPGSFVPKLKRASIPAFGFSEDSIVAGTLRVDIQPLSAEQKERLENKFKGEKVPLNMVQFRLVPKNGMHFAGFGEVTRLTRSHYKRWPSGDFALFSFDVEAGSPTLSPNNHINVSLPGIMLVHSVFSGKAIDSSMAFVGKLELQTDKELPEVVAISDRVEIFTRAKEFKKPFLVLHKSTYQILLEKAVASEHLENLFNPQLLSYVDLDDAIKLAIDEAEELRTKAEAAFQEIVMVINKMPLEEMAQNEKIQERLQKIIDEYPRHLSARIMLGYGKRMNSENQ